MLFSLSVPACLALRGCAGRYFSLMECTYWANTGAFVGTIGKVGNEDLFHVVFAIVDNETDQNWTWFFSTLREVLYGEDDYKKVITFVSDRSKGLVNKVAKVFSSTPHCFLLRYLEANFM